MSEAPGVTHAMLMAAGLGTRMRPYTDRVPKAAIPLMGVPVAQFAIDALNDAGISHAVMNLHHLPAEMRAMARRLDRGALQLELSDESGELLGSGGGIRKAAPLLGRGAFVYLNADVLTDLDIAELVRAHELRKQSFGALMTLALKSEGPTGGKYREIRFDPSIHRMTALGEVTYGKPFFMGAAVIEPDALRFLPATGPAEFVPSILEPALRLNRVGVHLTDAHWEDIGEPKLWLKAHLELLERLETGDLHHRVRRRIESHACRVGSRVWVDQSAPHTLATLDWEGPAYWSPFGNPDAHAPSKLGPRAVLYGSAEKVSSDFRDQIAMN